MEYFIFDKIIHNKYYKITNIKKVFFCKKKQHNFSKILYDKIPIVVISPKPY